MRKFAVILTLALFAAVSTIGTITVPTPAVAQGKAKGKAKAAVPPTASSKTGKGAGTCGTGKYRDKKTKKCVDAADKKSK